MYKSKVVVRDSHILCKTYHVKIRFCHINPVNVFIDYYRISNKQTIQIIKRIDNNNIVQSALCLSELQKERQAS